MASGCVDENSTTSDPTGILVAARTCRDQFAALLASSLPRCGAASPAHLATSNSPLMLSMWRNFIVGPACACSPVVVVEPVWNDDAPEPNRHFSFGVSLSTLGVTRPITEMKPPPHSDIEGEWDAPGNGGWWAYYPDQWLAPDVYLSYRKTQKMTVTGIPITSLFVVQHTPPAEAGGTPVCCISPSASSSAAAVCIAADMMQCSFGMNERWLVVWFLPAENEKPKLALRGIKLPTARDGGGATTENWVFPRSSPFSDVESYYYYGVFMNKANPNEALLASVKRDGANYVLIDVAKTHETKQVVVLSTAQLCYPAHSSHEGALAMRKKDGSVVFFASVDVLSQKTRRVYEVVPSSSSAASSVTPSSKIVTSDCNRTGLSQVSPSLFCISYSNANSAELWDCNDTSFPLRRVDTYAKCFHFRDVVGGGNGLLLAWGGGGTGNSNNSSVTVMEALSGLVVLTFNVPFQIECISSY